MPSRSHIVLCGSDGLAIRVLEELVALGEDVVLVTADGDSALADDAREAGVELVVGNFRREATLARTAIDEADALALLEDDDVANVSAALAAQEGNPDLHLVVRMFNIELGRSLERLFADCRILSAAVLAAPAFAEAAIHGQTGQTVTVRGRTLEVCELAADDSRLVAALAIPGETGDEHLFPAGAERVLALAERTQDEAGAGARARQVASLRKRTGARLGGFAGLFDRRLALLLAALVVIVAISSAVFERYHELAWIDALYFTITTITTTGYGDINLWRRMAR